MASLTKVTHVRVSLMLSEAVHTERVSSTGFCKREQLSQLDPPPRLSIISLVFNVPSSQMTSWLRAEMRSEEGDCPPGFQPRPPAPPGIPPSQQAGNKASSGLPLHSPLWTFSSRNLTVRGAAFGRSESPDIRAHKGH